jgi:SAM-dependent methyltransferase
MQPVGPYGRRFKCDLEYGIFIGLRGNKSALCGPNIAPKEPLSNMDETSKTKKLWGDLERSILTGKGIDIGCGPDPLTSDVCGFDKEAGDANEITKYVREEFDFVFSSHCLEHMKDPREAIQEWWKLVRPGGHLFFIVPDEDLYEQGVFPSRFNLDHKATFTISKTKSWSPVSINVLDLVKCLPGAQLVNVALQDVGYDRKRLRHSQRSFARLWVGRVYGRCFRPNGRSSEKLGLVKRTLLRFMDDQTRGPEAVAQIQCIVKKVAGARSDSCR